MRQWIRPDPHRPSIALHTNKAELSHQPVISYNHHAKSQHDFENWTGNRMKMSDMFNNARLIERWFNYCYTIGGSILSSLFGALTMTTAGVSVSSMAVTLRGEPLGDPSGRR